MWVEWTQVVRICSKHLYQWNHLTAPHRPFLLSEVRSPQNLRFAFSQIGEIQQTPAILLPLPLSWVSTADMYGMFSLLHGFWDLNSGPCDSIANLFNSPPPLTLKPSFQITFSKFRICISCKDIKKKVWNHYCLFNLKGFFPLLSIIPIDLEMQHSGRTFA